MAQRKFITDGIFVLVLWVKRHRVNAFDSHS